MKRYLLLIPCLLLSMTITAGWISEQQALQEAQRFMPGKKFEQRHLARGAASSVAKNLYVFNVEANGGFVIVSGNDNTDAILGYSTKGSFDEGDLPTNVRAWMEQIAAEVEACQSVPMSRSAELVPKHDGVAIHARIEPLITTTWDQGNWYNDINSDGVYNVHLPKINGKYPCTGCVATAGAQLMYYYRWPQTMTQSVPGYESSSEANTGNALAPIQFQWDKMKTKYVANDPNTEAVNAIADLMLYCGYAAKMNYGIDGSGASAYTLADGMSKYFDYNPNTWKEVSRYQYTINEWDELIYNELANGRPVMYSGSSSKGGHVFLCDGYDGAGMFHFNWGWGGSYDGFFKLQVTNPYGKYGEGYVADNDCIIGLQPNSWPDIADPNADDQWEVTEIDGLVATALHPIVEASTVKLDIGNFNGQPYAFGYGIAEVNDDGTLTVVDNSKEYLKEMTPLGSGYYYVDIKFDFSKYSLSEGRHMLVPVSLLNDESEWRRCKPADLWFEVNVVGGEKDIVVHPIDQLQINDFDIISGGNPGNIQYMRTSITNLGDNIEKRLYLHVGTDDDKGEYYSSRYVSIAAGNTKEYRLPMGRLEAGTYTIWLTSDYAGNDVLAKKKVIIMQDLQATDFEFIGNPLANEIMQINVTVENRGDDYVMPLYLFASTDDTKQHVYTTGSAIEGGGSEVVTFYFKPTVLGSWNLWIATDIDGTNIIGQSTLGLGSQKSGITLPSLDGTERTLLLCGETYTSADLTLIKSGSLTVSDDGETLLFNNLVMECEVEESAGNLISADIFNGANMNAINIVLTGENQLTTKGYEAISCRGIDKLTISGKGSLTLNSDYIDISLSSGYYNVPNGELVIDNTTLTCMGYYSVSSCRNVIVNSSRFEGNRLSSNTNLTLEGCSIRNGDVSSHFIIATQEDNTIPSNMTFSEQTLFCGHTYTHDDFSDILSGRFSVSSDGKVLTFDNLNIASDKDLFKISNEQVEIRLKGENKIHTTKFVVMELQFCDLTITGDGSLTTQSNWYDFWLYGCKVTIDHTTLKCEGYTAFGNNMQPMDKLIVNHSTFIGKSFSRIASLTLINCSFISPKEVTFDPDDTENSQLKDSSGNNVRGFEIHPVEGDFSNAVSPWDFGNLLMAKGKDRNFTFSMKNEGTEEIREIAYTWSVGGVVSSEKRVALTEPYAQTGDNFTVSIPVESRSNIGKEEVLLMVTKVNNHENASARKTAKGILHTMEREVSKRVVVEEFCATWCGWSPRGTIALELLNKEYGDNIITIAAHQRDPMDASSYTLGSNSTPTARVNRGELADAYYGLSNNDYGIKELVEAELNTLSPADLEVVAAWNNEDNNAVKIDTKTTFLIDEDASHYGIGFALIEDGMKGNGDDWIQNNYYTGRSISDPNLQPLSALPNQLTDTEYNHVAVDAWGIIQGIDGSVKDIQAGVQQGFSHVCDISQNGLIQDKSRLTVVALLFDKKTGKICNAAKTTIGDYRPTVVVTAKSYTRAYGEANPVFEYTTEGANLNVPPIITCEASDTSPVGNYSIVIKEGEATNIDATYVNGTLTITKAPLTIKVGDYTKLQGSENPEFTLTYEGFKNGETEAVFSKNPIVTTTADRNSPAGVYNIFVTGAEAQNYEISYVAGTLTVEKRPKGDLDAKGYTDVTDVVAAINHVLGERTLNYDEKEILDMNDDGELNVGDIILLVKAILEQGNVVNIPVMARGETENIDLTMYTAMQLTVNVPNGTKIRDIRLAGDNNSSHRLMYQQKDAEHYTVVVYSMSNQRFKTVNGSLLEVDMEGEGEPTTANVLLATPTGERTFINSLPIGTVTGISIVGADQAATGSVYDLRGNKVLDRGASMKQLPKGVYIMNGKKIIK